MIHFSTFEHELFLRIRQALEAHIDVELATTWETFVNRLSSDPCSVLVLSGSMSVECRTFLHSLLPASAMRKELTVNPVVCIDCRDSLARNISARAAGEIPNEVVSLEEIGEMLADAIARETSRAAVEFAWYTFSNNDNLHRLLLAALRIILRSEKPVLSVRQAAARSSCDASTLHQYWNSDVSKSVTLKDFVDLVLLVRARRRKSPRISWRDVALEYDTSVRHLREIAGRVAGEWPRSDLQRWVGIAEDLRAIASRE